MKRYMKASKRKSNGNLKRTALFFREEQMEKLQLLSRGSGAPVAELVRRAVDSYLDLRRSEWEAAKRSK
jgi:hypothetical protein